MSPAETRIKWKIEESGRPLKEWDIQINYGIKTGFNDAFIISGQTKDELIRRDANSAELIRPVLRGRDIKRYKANFEDLWLINTHNGQRSLKLDRINVERDYPAIFEYLNQQKFKPLIETREDQGSHWTNLRNCAYLLDLEKPKIIYPEITKFLPFVYDDSGYYLNNKTFFMVGTHLKYLVAFFNSTLFKSVYKTSFPDLGEDRRELRKVFFEQIKVIKPSETLEKEFCAYVDQILARKEENLNTAELENELDLIFYDMYDLSKEEVTVVKSSWPL
ncbi:TaqI-like C-terminal specificity domain-containing protein (plasmid) [Spirosoma sp. SC4-14]|uniref:TaqI-like C-terminal specificity domain-containing protein n=1 Tax=Spirosoma sp. SC4-14 TaxID=3128900 RepID=UPI0030CC2832